MNKPPLSVGRPAVRVLGIGGTLRPTSSSARALEVALTGAGRAGAETEMIAGPALNLPMYQPGAADGVPEAEALVEAMRRADGYIVASPGYHGGISGMVKNALDYAEEIKDDRETYWDGRAAGCIVAAHGAQAGATTLLALRSVVHALRGWPTPLGVCVNSAEPLFGPDGSVADPQVEERLTIVGYQVAEFAQARRSQRVAA